MCYLREAFLLGIDGPLSFAFHHHRLLIVLTTRMVFHQIIRSPACRCFGSKNRSLTLFSLELRMTCLLFLRRPSSSSTTQQVCKRGSQAGSHIHQLIHPANISQISSCTNSYTKCPCICGSGRTSTSQHQLSRTCMCDVFLQLLSCVSQGRQVSLCYAIVSARVGRS